MGYITAFRVATSEGVSGMEKSGRQCSLIVSFCLLVFHAVPGNIMSSMYSLLRLNLCLDP